MSKNHNQRPQGQASAGSAGTVVPEGDARVSHDADLEARGTRALEDFGRANDEGTALTLEDRRRLIRSEFTQEALPNVPAIPGYHVCWLSMTSSYDPIHKRMRLGYMPVRAEELPGLQNFRMSSGEFEGCIACNEMLLFKIAMEQYQAIMSEFHDVMPAEEEEALKARLKKEDAVDSQGNELGIVEGDGFEKLVQRRRSPHFS